MTKANKTVFIIFCSCVYMHLADPFPPCHKVSHWTDPLPSLKRGIINEWPLSSSPKCSCKFSFRFRHRFTSYQVVVVVNALCLLLFSGCRCVLQKQPKRKLNVQVFFFTNVGCKAVNIIRRENVVVLLFLFYRRYCDFNMYTYCLSNAIHGIGQI